MHAHFYKRRHNKVAGFLKSLILNISDLIILSCRGLSCMLYDVLAASLASTYQMTAVPALNSHNHFQAVPNVHGGRGVICKPLA